MRTRAELPETETGLVIGETMMRGAVTSDVVTTGAHVVHVEHESSTN